MFPAIHPATDSLYTLHQTLLHHLFTFLIGTCSPQMRSAEECIEATGVTVYFRRVDLTVRTALLERRLGIRVSAANTT